MIVIKLLKYRTLLYYDKHYDAINYTLVSSGNINWFNIILKSDSVVKHIIMSALIQSKSYILIDLELLEEALM